VVAGVVVAEPLLRDAPGDPVLVSGTDEVLVGVVVGD
jgi:hypothetical protein